MATGKYGFEDITPTINTYKCGGWSSSVFIVLVQVGVGKRALLQQYRDTCSDIRELH